MRRLNIRDDGAAAVMVALLMAALIGMAAIVVDVGALYQERRELQNGADAAVLAVAEECVREQYLCPAAGMAAIPGTDPYERANHFAPANANDAASNLGAIPSNFPLCADREPDDDRFLEGVCFGDSEVTVTVTSRDASGNSFISHWFAPVLGALTGSDSPRDSSRVWASASAAWGSPSSMATVPLTISSCEYDSNTGYGTDFAEPDYWDEKAAGKEATLLFHDGNTDPNSGCPVAPANMDTNGDGFLPAGFGWLETDGACNVVTTTVSGEDWATKRAGNSPPPGCDAATLFAKIKPGTVVGLPVFDDFCRPSQDPSCPTFNNRDKYHIARYAAFYVTGYRLGSPPTLRKWDGVYRMSAPCAGPPADRRCLSGFFTTDVVTTGDLGGPPGSITVVKLTR